MKTGENQEGIVSSALGLPGEHHAEFPAAERDMDGRIKTAHQAQSAPFEDQLRDVEAAPLTQKNLLSKLGWVLFWLTAIGVGFVVTKEMPGMPQWIFCPIVAVVLVLQLVLKQWLFGMSLRLDSRMLVYGPLWSRKKCPFSEIMAVQLLHVSRIAKKNKKHEKLFEVNIVISPHTRIHFASHTEKEKATNIAHSLCDVVKAPLVEQLCV